MLATDWSSVVPDLPADFVKGALAVSGLYELAPLQPTSMNSDIRLTDALVAQCSPARLQPRLRAPLFLSFGGLESDEFKRQTRLIADKWSALGCVERAERRVYCETINGKWARNSAKIGKIQLHARYLNGAPSAQLLWLECEGFPSRSPVRHVAGVQDFACTP